MTSWSTAWVEAARMRGDRAPFLITRDETVTYGELQRDVMRCIGLFAELDIERDARVAVCSRSPRHTAVVALAALLGGRTLVPLDPEAPAKDLEGLIERVRPAGLFADLAVLDRVERDTWAAVALGQPRPLTISDRLLGRRRASTESPETFLGRLADVSDGELPKLDADGPAMIIFTSGSTGRPKGVCLSRGAVSHHLDVLDRTLDYGGGALLNVLPLHHADGLTQGPILAYATGSTLVRPGDFSIAGIPELLDSVYTHKVTHFITVPAMLALIDRLADSYLDAFEGERFRAVVSNAAPLSEDLWRRIEERFGITVCNSYGLTETVTSSLMSGPDEARHRCVGTVGRPIDGEVVLLDEQGAEISETVARGEIGIRGPHLFSGYLDDREATGLVFDGHTFRTGDVAERDAGGVFRIVGRKSSTIITGGTNVAPEEIDLVVEAVPDVLESATVGIEDPIWGERAVTAVVARPLVDESTILEECRMRLAPAKVPRAIVFVDAIPRTPVGKVDRRAIAAIVRESVNPEGDVTDVVRMLAAGVFGVEPGRLSPDSGPDDTPGWDSVAHIELVTLVEEQYGIEFSNIDVIGIRSLRDLVERCRQHLR